MPYPAAHSMSPPKAAIPRRQPSPGPPGPPGHLALDDPATRDLVGATVAPENSATRPGPDPPGGVSACGQTVCQAVIDHAQLAHRSPHAGARTPAAVRRAGARAIRIHVIYLFVTVCEGLAKPGRWGSGTEKWVAQLVLSCG